MTTIHKEITIQTTANEEMINVTKIVMQMVGESKIKNGFVLLFVPHTTAAITINENADQDVKHDFLIGLADSFPKQSTYRHFEGNSHAHIKSSVIGVDQMILLEEGMMVLGTWQGIYFCEFDGPRRRRLSVKVIGE